MGKRLTLVLTLVLALAMMGTSLTYAKGRGQKGQRGDRSGTQLTDEERAARRAKMQERREAAGAQLTDEQKAALQAKVQEMKDAGATAEEIRDARRELLKGWGIDVPEKQGLHQGRGGRLGAQLTKEQRTAIRDRVREMKESGASSEDIRKAVREKVQAYGEQPAVE